MPSTRTEHRRRVRVVIGLEWTAVVLVSVLLWWVIAVFTTAAFPTVSRWLGIP